MCIQEIKKNDWMLRFNLDLEINEKFKKENDYTEKWKMQSMDFMYGFFILNIFLSYFQFGWKLNVACLFQIKACLICKKGTENVLF